MGRLGTVSSTVHRVSRYGLGLERHEAKVTDVMVPEKFNVVILGKPFSGLCKCQFADTENHFTNKTSNMIPLVALAFSDVKSSRPKFRPRPRSFGLGLGLEVLASAWPRSRCLIM